MASEADPRVAAINADHECPGCGAGWDQQVKISAGRWRCRNCAATYKPGDSDGA